MGMISEIQAWELTDTNRDWLIHRPVEIAIYVALAVVLRFALHRGIDRMSKPRKSPNARVNERRSQRARTIGSVLKSTVSIVILVWCVLQILGILGINVAPFIASAGVIGLAIGFGAQNLVRDFLSGIFMLLEDQYGVGDVVDLEVMRWALSKPSVCASPRYEMQTEHCGTAATVKFSESET